MKSALMLPTAPLDLPIAQRPAGLASTRPAMLRVLLVEDSPVDTMRLRQMLSRARNPVLRTESVSSLGAALDRVGRGGVDVVLLDLTLPDAAGIEPYSGLACAAPALPIVVLTSLANERLGVEAVRLGAQDYLVKPQVSPQGLGRAIACAVERHRVVASLRGLSLTDEMTGLLNRRGFQTIGTGHLKLGNRTGSRFLLFFIDLDDLKRINDTWGHHEGDHAIIRTADVLRATFRQSDIVARLGGDEFVVLALDTSDDQGAALRGRLKHNLAVAADRGSPYTLSVSVGIVAFDALEDRPLVELLIEADQALYREKSTRR